MSQPVDLIDYRYLEDTKIVPDYLGQGNDPLGKYNAMSILQNGSANSSLLQTQLQNLNNTEQILSGGPQSVVDQQAMANDAATVAAQGGSSIVAKITKSKGISSFLSLSVENFVAIIVGLILIAAGVFAFKQTQTIIQTGTRAASAAGELFA